MARFNRLVAQRMTQEVLRKAGLRPIMLPQEKRTANDLDQKGFKAARWPDAESWSSRGKFCPAWILRRV